MSRTVGIILIVLGLAAIAAGIILKRMLALGEYLFVFHSLGGLLLVIGISVFVLGKKEK